MSNGRLKMLLVVSLAFNFAVLGALAYGWAYGSRRTDARRSSAEQSRRQYARKCRHLADRVGMRRDKTLLFEGIMREYATETAALREDLHERRRELLELFAQDQLDEDTVLSKVREIAELQGELEKLLVLRLLKTHELFTPEERGRFLNMLRCRMAPECRKHFPFPGAAPSIRKDGQL